jgi:type I restriction enzyme M protein
MLTSETKRKIDNCRDSLVGKIPVPSAQIEQITLALIYKFMSDIDHQNQELGGTSFFEGDFAKYKWSNLMDKRLWAQERMNLYTEGLESMGKNKHLPELFRNIFRNAYLPFKDPQTLDRFLKHIDEFTYGHSEELGNAFEYLLSTAGSQWDAGQFRTPRHIIDFIVSVVEPTKDDTILDPACGTAWFLISAYKYILQTNRKDKPGDLLSLQDKKNLTKNIVGYDISHEMVRLSLVNLYLHNFGDPKIHEYDTLSQEDRRQEDYDCILANPPFMTPKGGIQPHKRFSIQANKSEVLFVDYMMEHLKINGKAGIIVPEGIVFQNPNAYKQLRKKMIDENYLWAVVSLPSGVFQPYSWVKTCILLFDKNIAKKADKILFVKIDNDWFSPWAQRKPINKNDLPAAYLKLKDVKEEINKWGLNSQLLSNSNALYIEKAKIVGSWDYNLNIDNYRESDKEYNCIYDMVSLWEIAEFVRWPFWSSIKKSVCVPKWDNVFKLYEQGNVIRNDFYRWEYYIDEKKFNELSRFEVKPNDILMTCAWTLWKLAIVPPNIEKWIINSVLMRIRVDRSKINNNYLIKILSSNVLQKKISNKSTWVAVSNLFATSELKKFKIPLPSLSVQEQIVEELDRYQDEIAKKKEEIIGLEGKIDENIEKIWGE